MRKLPPSLPHALFCVPRAPTSARLDLDGGRAPLRRGPRLRLDGPGHADAFVTQYGRESGRYGWHALRRRECGRPECNRRFRDGYDRRFRRGRTHDRHEWRHRRQTERRCGNGARLRDGRPGPEHPARTEPRRQLSV